MKGAEMWCLHYMYDVDILILVDSDTAIFTVLKVP